MKIDDQSASNPGAALMLSGALIGIALAAYGYFAPMTGITATPGALLVIVSSILLAIDAGILLLSIRGIWRGLFWVLGLLGTIGTLAAAFFLHAWLLMAAMVVVLAGLIIGLFRRKA